MLFIKFSQKIVSIFDISLSIQYYKKKHFFFQFNYKYFNYFKVDYLFHQQYSLLSVLQLHNLLISFFHQYFP